MKRIRPYEQLWYTSRPTLTTQWLRENIIFQLFRFIVLTIKILFVVMKGHD